MRTRCTRDARAIQPRRLTVRVRPRARHLQRHSITLGLDYDSSYGWADFAVQLILFFCFFFFLRSTLKACKRIYKKFRLPAEVAVSGAFGVTMGDASIPGAVKQMLGPLMGFMVPLGIFLGTNVVFKYGNTLELLPGCPDCPGGKYLAWAGDKYVVRGGGL